MKENQVQNNPQSEVEVAYEKPAIEVIEMEMEQPVLVASGSDFEPDW
ncbi:hypothetical protein SAMN05216365_13430 [Porphyromonadaceae bacterium NLAE-zl-C104]|nr:MULTISPECIES: hypothetical protein [Proteiniphilum]MDY9917283.1 hypothetical protein [Proteiniphilum sp.]SDZ87752.1 hypothetical protein SAMN05216331_10853 [Porphyromonadaceae bacterium KH3R12]SFS95386.1 hypothetical protein SAMN05216365_13430 [Porphyromonadaceae bacterium NLAE-zl-C104]